MFKPQIGFVSLSTKRSLKFCFENKLSKWVQDGFSKVLENVI